MLPDPSEMCRLSSRITIDMNVHQAMATNHHAEE